MNFYKISQGCLLLSSIISFSSMQAAEIKANFVKADLSKLPTETSLWSKAPEVAVSLVAQPMANPRPKTTTTSEIKVQALHNGEWAAFRLSWADPQKDEAGPLGKYSDAVAIQFPGKMGPPPPIFMGAKDNPVHILHWRAQYQVDKEQGFKEPSAYYPNMQIDMYPMEFNNYGNVTVGLSDKEIYSPGIAAGNPQSQRKIRAVDEIIAEGFGSSTIAQNAMAVGSGVWENGRWTVIIARPLHRENGSVLLEGGSSNVGFAVWEGGKDEVGSRKCVTMSWTPISFAMGDKE